MSDYLTPGIYFQNVFPPPEPSFLTGVPAFLGRASTGPNTPQRLTLWPQFEETFGAASGGFLAEAVRGFFENDGLLCYAVRLEQAEPVKSGLERALVMLNDVDDIDLICAPGMMASAMIATSSSVRANLHDITEMQHVLLEHCRDRGDRFAILDGAPALDPAMIADQRRDLDGNAGAGSYGALYYPWLDVGKKNAQGNPVYLPPSGHIAGIYARVDAERGVHQAPANKVVEGVLDLQVNLTGDEVSDLYEQGVNCLRALPGRGIRPWGARTLSTGPHERDVNVRRLVGTISRWIERFMMRLVYEPHDALLWTRITRELTAYLEELFQRGALQGRTADEAFFVKCDNETNLSETMNSGMVVTQVGVAPTAPTEFIIIRVIHGVSGVTVRAA